MTTPRPRRAAALPPGLLPRLLFGLLLGLILAPFPAGDVLAKDPPPRHPVPEGRPIQLDGRPLVAEWSAGLDLPLGDGHSKLRLMQFRGTLMVAFQSTLPWPPRTSLTLYFAPDGVAGGAQAQGATSIAFEPFNHDRAHVFAFHHGPDGFERLHDRIVVRRVLTEQGSALEMAFGLDVLGLTKDSRPALRCAVLWSHPNAPGATWPAGLKFVGTTASQKPPALATTKAWGLLDGWGDPTGPGAFAKADWKAWIERDRELTHRGRDAHAEVKLLIEEWKGTKKRDSEFQKAVLDEFDWLSRQERLTAADLIAMAQTYRFLNRSARALGLLESLVNHPDPVPANYARWVRAQALEDAEAYLAAAADWEALAKGGHAAASSRYTARAARARERHAAWTLEQQRRAEDSRRGDLPRVALHTNRGLIVLELFENDVPDAVKHFLGLVASKFYDKTCFHRVLGANLAQGGCPKSRELGCSFAGKGTSAREIDLEMNERHGFWRGAVGFANKAHDPRNGSQFFLMTAPRPNLGRFTCFGHVVAGQDVVDRIEWGDVIRRAVVLPPGPKIEIEPPEDDPEEGDGEGDGEK